MNLNDLIERLERSYPDSIPRRSINEFEHGEIVGQQEIIDCIKRIRDNEIREVF